MVTELKKAWEDREAGSYYTPAKIIEMNLEHCKKLDETGKYNYIAEKNPYMLLNERFKVIRVVMS